jgi:hypothetical protein
VELWEAVLILDQGTSPARGDIRPSELAESDADTLGLGSKSPAHLSSDGSESVAVGHKMAPAKRACDFRIAGDHYCFRAATLRDFANDADAPPLPAEFER